MNFSFSWQCYKRILQLDPINIQGLHNLCVVYVERGKLAKALACLHHAHQLAPTEDYILRHLQIVQNRIQKLRQMDGMEKEKELAFGIFDPNDFGGNPINIDGIESISSSDDTVTDSGSINSDTVNDVGQRTKTVAGTDLPPETLGSNSKTNHEPPSTPAKSQSSQIAEPIFIEAEQTKPRLTNEQVYEIKKDSIPHKKESQLNQKKRHPVSTDDSNFKISVDDPSSGMS